MGFVMPHITVLIGAGALGLGLLLQIIGLATNEWITAGGSGSGSLGLWKICGGSTCVDYDPRPDYIDACRAFGILAVLVIAAGLLFAALICLMNEQKIFTLLAPVAAAVGAFLILIEFAVYAGKIGDTFLSFDFGYSFVLTIIACLLCAAAAVLFFLGRGRAS